MWIPKEVGRMATRLRDGHRVNRVTVRDLLRMFRAERRGLNKVHDIRSALDSLGLETDPDFESAWIDSLIRIRLRDPDSSGQMSSESDAVEDNGDDLEDDQLASSEEQDDLSSPQVDGGPDQRADIVATSEGVIETALGEQADPTFRIGSLPAANKQLETVGQDDPLNKAITKMLLFDYSQLPIMHGEREVKGMITWKAIASRYAFGCECYRVQNCREDAQVIDANGTLFDAIPTIVKHGYVLVRSQQDRRITGIVTASDLSLQFRQLAEPFLLLREIELHIRQLLQGKVCIDDLRALASSDDSGPKPESLSDLSFGGYIRLLQNPGVWARLSLNVDQASLTAHLDEVRQIRNDVMHFDPDPITPNQLNALKDAAKFMQQIYALLPS